MKARKLAALALDPSRILTARGFAVDPWQRVVLHSRERQLLLNCCRQAGKSTVVSALALHQALFEPRALTLILSPGQRQSAETFRKVRDLYRAVGRPIEATHESLQWMELANGSRIVCLPGVEETVRCFSPALVIVDEAARVPDDLYRAVRPMLAVSQGRLVALSTPFGQRGWFFDEWHGKGPWHRVRVTWHDCPRIAAAFIAEEISGQRVGGIDWGWRNPFAAVWGVLDANDVLWLDGERYLSETTLHEHAKALPRGVMWYADPAGATEIAELRRAGHTVRKGINDIRLGIAAVTARLRTGRLRIDARRCSWLCAEAKLYRYPSTAERAILGENPIDEHNHALGALRYLVSRVDARYIARLRRAPGEAGLPTEAAAGVTESRGAHANLWENEDVWDRLS
jgi:hypothetical protein